MGRPNPVGYGQQPSGLGQCLFSGTKVPGIPVMKYLDHRVTSYHSEPEETDPKPKSTLLQQASIKHPTN